MKVPCTECKKVCKRKVVTRGPENLNRIYYKCEECNHKVGWEDELAAGAKPWTRKHQAPQPQAPVLLPPQQRQAAAPMAQQQRPQQQQQQQQQRQPTPPQPPKAQAGVQKPSPGRNDSADDVEIVFERPAPGNGKARASAAAAGATATGVTAAGAGGKPGGPHDPSPNGYGEGGHVAGPTADANGRPRTRAHEKLHRAQVAGKGEAGSPPPEQSRGRTRAKQPDSGQDKTVAAAAGPAARRSQPASPAGTKHASPEEAINAAAATKRKFDEAFADSAGRAAKRPVHEAPASTAAAAPGNVFAARNIPTAGAARTNAAQAAGAAATGAAAPPAAQTGAQAAAGASGRGPAGTKAEGQNMFARLALRSDGPGPVNGTGAGPAPAAAAANGAVNAAAAPTAPAANVAGWPAGPGPGPPFGSRAAAAAAAQAQGAVHGANEGSGAFSPGRGPGLKVPLQPDAEEVLRQEVRRLRRELAVVAAQLKQEQVKAQQEAAAAASARLRLEPLERELQESKLQLQRSVLRERQLTERLNLYIARERAQAAQAEHEQHFAYAWFQQRNFHNLHQQQQQHPHQQQQQQQQDCGGTAYGAAAGPGATVGGGGSPPRAAPQRQSNGGAAPSARGAGGSQRTNGAGAGGASAGAGAGGGPGAAQPPPAAPRDDPAVFAFALSPPPTLDDTTTVRALKQFLAEAGAESSARLCSEKADLLRLARERINSWEIRRAVMCSRLASQVQGDCALFRINPAGGLQRAALVKAYRDLLIRLHPDKNPGDEMATPAFQYMQDAYKRLGAMAAG